MPLLGGAKITNKVLVLVYVPALSDEYSVFIPIGKTIGAVKKVMMDVIGDFSGQQLQKEMKLLDRETNNLYENDMVVKNTGIRNGTRLLLI